MNETRSSILLFSEDTALRERVAGILEREIDVVVDARTSEADLQGLEADAFAAAVVDVGPEGGDRPNLLTPIPSNLPVLTLLNSGGSDSWIRQVCPAGESLERDAPDEHIIHALRLSLLRTMQRAKSDDEPAVKTRVESTQVATRSVLGDLRAEFRSDLASVLRRCEDAIQSFDAAEKPETASDVVIPDELIIGVRALRKLSDTLDLAEYSPLTFALEVSLRDLPSEDGRRRVQDLLRQLRNLAAGRPASAGFDGRRLRVALVGATESEAHALGLEDPDRLDVRPVPDIRRFARQVDLFRPDVVALRVGPEHGANALLTLREIRGGTSESVLALTDRGVELDPIDTIRFPRFAQFSAPFDWHAVTQRIFEFEGEFERPRRVLVVHDDHETIREVELCLDPESFVVQSVGSARELVDEVQRLGPDIVFVGDNLEKISGFDLCRELRAELPLARIPVIILSRRYDRAGREQAFRVGADDYLELPLLPEEVRRRAENLIDLRHLKHASTATDPLTGLADACTMSDHLEVALREAAAADEWISFLSLDIDRYSMIKNFYGIASANTIVRSVADALRKIFDHEDMIFRGTDDEFFVLRRSALKVSAERDAIFEGIADIGRLTFRSADGRGFYATVTGGHVLVPPGSTDVTNCIRRGLRVLTAAKKMARGKIMSAEIDPDFGGDT